MKSIDVITSIDTDGVITPIRARIEEDEETYAFDLKLISREKVGKYIRYICKANINNCIKVIDLRFYSEELKWYIVK